MKINREIITGGIDPDVKRRFVECYLAGFGLLVVGKTIFPLAELVAGAFTIGSIFYAAKYGLQGLTRSPYDKR